MHWHFRERVLQPASHVKIGQVYRLTLEPWALQADIQPFSRTDLGEAPPMWWSAVAGTASGSGEASEGGAKRRVGSKGLIILRRIAILFGTTGPVRKVRGS